MEFYSHGKLLLTAEYAVLEGVKALAVPTKRGQFLRVEHTTEGTIKWQSFTVEGKLWIDCIFDLKLTYSIVHPNSSRAVRSCDPKEVILLCVCSWRMC